MARRPAQKPAKAATRKPAKKAAMAAAPRRATTRTKTAAPRWVLVDPRPIAKEAPYTFFLPSAAELAAQKPGDKVYLDIQAVPRRQKWESERMWATITKAGRSGLTAKLEHQPDDIPGLKLGDMVDFKLWHVLQIDFADPALWANFDAGEREYWERCLVDQAVLDGELKVEYLYREKPDMGQRDDPYPDSGWRIRGDTRDCSDKEVQKRPAAYVALGAVLNADDSWLHLIDEPIGLSFERNYRTGKFKRIKDAT
jgi:hypothetical protein